MVRKPLGEILIELKKLSPALLEQALEYQEKHQEKLGNILLQWGLVTVDDIFMALAKQYNYPFIDLKNYSLDAEVLSLVPADIALKYQTVPFSYNKKEALLSLAMAPPFDFKLFTQLEQLLGKKIKVALTAPLQIEEKLRQHYQNAEALSYTQKK